MHQDILKTGTTMSFFNIPSLHSTYMERPTITETLNQWHEVNCAADPFGNLLSIKVYVLYDSFLSCTLASYFSI